MPKISVIVPVYNVEQYLSRCVESILSQTFSDFELILVDDESPDGCPILCDAYAEKDNRVKVIHKENGGVSSARNTGLDAASGDYVVFVDSDDHIFLDWLQQLYTAAQAMVADLVIGGYVEEDEQENAVKKVMPTSEMIDMATVQDRLMYLLVDVLGYKGRKHGWSICTRLFRSDIIKNNDIRFCTTCGNYAEDMEFLLEFGLYCRRVCSIDTSGYRYMRRQDSMMGTSEDVIKLREVNEVSYQFGKRFFETVKEARWKRAFPVFHYLMLHHEYEKLVYSDKYAQLGEIVNGLYHLEWYKQQTRKIRCCYPLMKQLWGGRAAKQVLLLSRYGLHTDWNRFGRECAIAYKWFIRES